MLVEKRAQPLNEPVSCVVAMNADCPKSRVFLHGRPNLLGNPGQAPTCEWQACEAVGKIGNALCLQCPQSGEVESVSRCNPKLRVQFVTAQNLHPRLYPFPLRVFREACELRLAMQAENART